MIRQFILIGVILPGGGRAFFDMSMTFEFCRYDVRFIAAASFNRRIFRKGCYSLKVQKKRRL